MTSFADHGSLEMRLEGNILVIEGRGPWNQESLQKSGRIALPMVQSLYGKPWGVIGIFYGQPVYVPEAVKELVKVVSDEKKKGRVATALLLEECDLPTFSKQHIGDIYDRAGETYEFFANIDDARVWLNKLLEKASQSPTV